MERRKRLILIGFALTLGAAPGITAQPVDYLRDLKPLLSHRCYPCHGPLKRQAKLRLDTVAAMLEGGKRGAVVVPGDPAKSLLLGAMSGSAGFRMPPEGEGTRLTEAEVESFRVWIAGGAPAPADEKPAEDPRSWWSYRPVRRPAVPDPPAAFGAGRPANPIDAFLAAEQLKRGLTPRPPADPAVALRRLSLDLIGLPPTREESEAFLADGTDRAYEAAVDRLLASARYGERWGRHWMDVWRYSDWYGSRGGNEMRYSQRHIWRWRDWIIESLNADRGYDRMVLEMLAGDEIAPADPQVTRATGFLGRNWYKFDRNVWMFDAVEHTSMAFLGLTLKCARCHDHKFDPISQLDYYRFRAFFEPHDVRTDPLSALTGTEKDATLGQVLKDGVSRVYDRQLDVPTWLFTRGDSRRPDEKQPLAPGVPAAFGMPEVVIRPVALPLECSHPWLAPALVAERIAAAEAGVRTAEGGVADAGRAVAAAERKLSAQCLIHSLERESAGATAPPLPMGAVLADRFERSRPELWQVRGGRWECRSGVLAQDEPGAFRTLASLVPHPQDFMARVRYRTTEGGTIHSVGVFFDFGDSDAQAVYTATNDRTSTVQAFHRRQGTEHYPPAGIVPWPIRIRQEITLDLAARGQLLNVWVNGELAIVYTLPVARKAGTIALWTHQGTAEFSEILVDPLPDDQPLAAAAADKIGSPYAPPRREDHQRALNAARQGTRLAEAKLAIARLDLAALHARAEADRAQAGGSGEAGRLALAAGKAERQVAAARAEEAALGAELALEAGRRAGPPKEEAGKKALADAEAKATAAQKALEAARAAAQKEDPSYTPLGPSYPRTSTGRRLALARWMVDRENPRTARIAVNHLWLRHFGQALVPTVSNFGLNGQLPSHPELLDWLAAELMENGWSMKRLHRLMVTSDAYRRSSADGGPANPNLQLDPENRFLWRANSRRLESEAVRDSLLHLSGELDSALGGPEIEESRGQECRRRSLYFRSTPNEKMPFLELFDQANPNECYRRHESVVPQQSLALINSALALNQARILARRLSVEAGKDPDGDAFIGAAYRQVLARAPSEAELAACRRFLARNSARLTSGGPRTAYPAAGGAPALAGASEPGLRARENLVQVLFNHNDFVTVR